MDLTNLDDIELLTALILGESEAEPLLGKIAVACVVRNRVNDPRWPSAWRDVMLQNKQFSCFLPECFRPSIIKQNRRDPVWREANFAAHGVYNKYVRSEANGANHYHADYIETPYWVKNKDVVLSIGKHLFYRL